MRKIALILGGGPGGGSYAAGAVVELLTALERVRTADPPTLDVIVASSAAALPAAVAARALVVNPGLVPWIQRTWVDALDAGVLLDPGRPDRDGLLASGALHELAHTLIAGDRAADDRPSARFGGSLQVAFPLTPVRPSGAPVRSALFELGTRHGAGDPVWSRLATAALAASATPGLLPPVRLQGRDGTLLACDGEAGGDSLAALARALTARVDRSTGVRREAVVVEPRLFAGSEPSGSARSRTAGAGPLASLVAALGGTDPAAAWHEEALRQDRIAALAGLAEQIGELSGDLDDPRAVATGRRIGALAEEVADRRVARGETSRDGAADPGLAVLDRDVERISDDPRYSAAFRGVETRAGRTRLAKLIFILEEASGMGGQASGRLHAVAPPADRPLAGPALGGLAGPLCRAWRSHDFEAGRRDLRRALAEDMLDLPGEAAEASGEDPAPVRAGLDTLPADDRRRLDRFLEAEVDRWLEAVRPGGLAGTLFGLGRSGARRRGAAHLREALADLRI
ncbi:MAG: hypothetical protein Q8W51_14910 [Candidatus Palauibacterales bacterium]|nr:hypothetical protein [Candidatus Palauibacterales bacterium]MDP2531017.1 hypothetical protein [Candidatus Palauibacterales bacterium]MDP2583460.1 hypothetical protein [Candidatus Palauibacterales bacterium]